MLATGSRSLSALRTKHGCHRLAGDVREYTSLLDHFGERLGDPGRPVQDRESAHVFKRGGCGPHDLGEVGGDLLSDHRLLIPAQRGGTELDPGCFGLHARLDGIGFSDAPSPDCVPFGLPG
jgi:hypothetical protein